MEERHCGLWLPNKRRFCASAPLPNSSFCGNHNPCSEEERVPCPIDPSHSVFERNLRSHVKRCPRRKQAVDLESQRFYKKGINSGRGCSHGTEPSSFFSSGEKREAILGLSVPEFHGLISKIKSIRSSISTGIRDSYSIPEACSLWMKQMHARQLPFQEKHVLQQASVLGNMENFGVLEKKVAWWETAVHCDGWMERGELSGYEVDVPAVVEFGAGRGYLTHMLADCYGTRKVFLVERRSYKLKADRSLRQNKKVNVHRLRIDIEDLDLNAVEDLKENPYLAIGKHICGPATDLTLRCCLPRHHGEVGSNNISHSLKGLAVATCCHHLCQWEHYINKQFLEDMGITKDDFNAITWFSSWAVDADHSSDLLTSINEEEPLQKIEMTQMDVGHKDVEAVIRNMKPVDRAVFGFLCKEIIDIGRLLWLKERGLDAHLVKYIPYGISPENHLLVATSGTKL